MKSIILFKIHCLSPRTATTILFGFLGGIKDVRPSVRAYVKFSKKHRNLDEI